MIIVGAKGMAKEIISDYEEGLNQLYCFDNINKNIKKVLNKVEVLHSIEEATKLNEHQFILGLGNPGNRKLMYDYFIENGFEPKSYISQSASIGKLEVQINNAVTIMPQVMITVSATIGKGCLINNGATVMHDCKIGEFSELCPGVNISGNVRIGSNTFIGTGAIILPDITIGKNCVIGAGAVVAMDLPDNATAVGIPAKIIKTG